MNFWKIIYDLCMGFGVTLKLFALTLVIALPLGLIFALFSMSKFKPLAYLMKTFIWIIRGTPLLLQCVVVTFIPSVLLKIPNKDFANMLGIDTMADLQIAFVLIAFALNYAAYFAEIFRGGIMSIPVGQHEASKVLGLTKMQTFFHVVLPQVIKRVLLPVSNEVITLVKDTSLANIIAVSELFRAAKNEASRTASIEPLFVAGLFYLLMNGVVTLVFSRLTQHYEYYKD